MTEYVPHPFAALTYLQSSISQKRRNNCASLHVHKKLLDGIDVEDVAKDFVLVNDERIKYFGSFNSWIFYEKCDIDNTVF